MNTFAELFSALGKALDLCWSFPGHGERVGLMAYLLGKEIAPKEAPLLLYAGLLHDLGLIPYADFVPPGVTEPPSNDPNVFAHPAAGAQLIRYFLRHHTLADWVLEHHERWDGAGYPCGKKGEDVSLGGQILHIADAFYFALRSAPRNVSFTQALSPGAGKDFSPELYLTLPRILSPNSSWMREETQLKPFLEEALEQVPFPLDLSPEKDLDSVLTLFASLADTRRGYTSGHSEQVAQYAIQLSQGLGLPPEAGGDIGHAALCHDIGILGVPRSALEAQRRLTPEEKALVERHPMLTALVMSQVSSLRQLALMASYHHARYDGKGYPAGIKGDDIPLGARIIAVADSFDALTHSRPYRLPLTSWEALKVLKENSGSQFCPRVVQTALQVWGR